MNTSKARGVLIRILPLLLFVVLVPLAASCAPSPATSTDGKSEADGSDTAAGTEQYADSFTWTVDADCALCHSTEHDSLSDGGVTLAGFHATQGLSCSVCHTDTQVLTAAHEGTTSASKTPTRLKTTKVTEASCLSSACHVSEESLKPLTASSTALTDANGTVINPHDLSDKGDHDIISCVSCHGMHKDKPPDKTAKALCVSCHHENVFE
ncbi:MAG: cytochrome c3 family protein, partial [Coriobacteriales bacterium]|nr:cytochrome c3 family protein [Coriobacteriales bacterium]